MSQVLLGENRTEVLPGYGTDKTFLNFYCVYHCVCRPSDRYHSFCKYFQLNCCQRFPGTPASHSHNPSYTPTSIWETTGQPKLSSQEGFFSSLEQSWNSNLHLLPWFQSFKYLFPNYPCQCRITEEEFSSPCQRYKDGCRCNGSSFLITWYVVPINASEMTYFTPGLLQFFLSHTRINCLLQATLLLS